MFTVGRWSTHLSALFINKLMTLVTLTIKDIITARGRLHIDDGGNKVGLATEYLYHWIVPHDESKYVDYPLNSALSIHFEPSE